MGDGFAIGIAVGATGALILFAFVYGAFLLIRPWLMVKLQGGDIPMLGILGMRLRGTPVSLVTEAYTSLLQRGMRVDFRQVETQYIAYRGSITSARDLMDRMTEEWQRQEQRTADLDRREEQWRREQTGD